MIRETKSINHQLLIISHNLILLIATLAFITDVGAASWKSKRVNLELVSIPNIVYNGEKTSLCFRVKNKSYFTTHFSCHQSVSTEDGIIASKTRQLEIRGHREDVFLMPLDMKKFKEKRGSIEISLYRNGTVENEVAREKIIVRPADDNLSDIEAKIGHFEDTKGNRIIICTDWEDPSKYRRWAWAKWLRARSNRSLKNILLYGDRMDTGLEDSTSYVQLIENRVRQKGGNFRFIERASGPCPIISDLLKIDSLMEEIEPTPNVIILSFGLGDIRGSTPKSDYARAIDVIIDRIRLRKFKSLRIILVSPPPLVNQVKLSSSYRDEILNVARDHHVAFVDLHRLILGTNIDSEPARWSEVYYRASEIKATNKASQYDVLYLYPNTLGQKLIAEAIIRKIY